MIEKGKLRKCRFGWLDIDEPVLYQGYWTGQHNMAGADVYVTPFTLGLIYADMRAAMGDGPDQLTAALRESLDFGDEPGFARFAPDGVTPLYAHFDFAYTVVEEFDETLGPTYKKQVDGEIKDVPWGKWVRIHPPIPGEVRSFASGFDEEAEKGWEDPEPEPTPEPEKAYYGTEPFRVFDRVAAQVELADRDSDAIVPAGTIGRVVQVFDIYAEVGHGVKVEFPQGEVYTFHIVPGKIAHIVKVIAERTYPLASAVAAAVGTAD